MSSSGISKRINYKKINAVAFSQFQVLVRQWLPGGKLEGHDYVALNPTRHDNKPGSFRVDMRKGSYKDFATGDYGKDPISLYAYIFHGNDQGAAAKELGERLSVGTASQKITPSKKRAADWSVGLPPLDATEPPKAHKFRGLPEAVWCYRSEEGATLGYVYRFKTSDGGKVTIPLTWCRNSKTGFEGWHWKGFEVPRPLYGLERLATKPDATVLIVEGEKCADVAEQHLQDLVCLTWPNGSKAVDKANWGPLAGRKVIVWPDCDSQFNKDGVLLPEKDQPGVSAANKIAEKLVELGCKVWVVSIPKPGAKKNGWDIADAVDEGLTGEALNTWIREHLRPFVPEGGHGTDECIEGEFIQAGDNCHLNIPLERHAFTRFSDAKRTKPLATIENLNAVLDGYRISCVYNELLKKPIIKIGDNPVSRSDVYELAVDSRIRSLLELNRIKESAVDKIWSILLENTINPIRDWINSKLWDGNSRLEDFYKTISINYEGCGGDKDKAENLDNIRNIIMKRWLIQTVAAIDGGRAATNKEAIPKYELVMVLQGGQGSHKTSWVNTLLPVQFRDEYIKDGVTLDVDNADSKRNAISAPIVELGEIDATFRRSDIAKLKSFLSATEDSMRLPYAKAFSNFKRQTSYIATVNDSNFLIDNTGNRRWGAIPVQSCKCDHGIDLQQLYAEVWNLYVGGEQWWFTSAETVTLTPYAEAHLRISPIEEMLGSVFNLDADADAGESKELSATLALQECGIKAPNKADVNEASRFLKKRGVSYKVLHGYTVFNLVRHDKTSCGDNMSANDYWSNSKGDFH